MLTSDSDGIDLMNKFIALGLDVNIIPQIGSYIVPQVFYTFLPFELVSI